MHATPALLAALLIITIIASALLLVDCDVVLLVWDHEPAISYAGLCRFRTAL